MKFSFLIICHYSSIIITQNLGIKYKFFILYFFLDENECEKLFTKLKNNWSTCKIIFSVTKEAITFIDLIAAKCNKEIEFTQLLINDLFSVPPKLK